MVQGQGAASPSTFTVLKFPSSSGNASQLTLPAAARGKRALVFTWWQGADKYGLFTLYSLSPEGEWTLICDRLLYSLIPGSLVPRYDPKTVTVTASFSPSWDCHARLLY